VVLFANLRDFFSLLCDAFFDRLLHEFRLAEPAEGLQAVFIRSNFLRRSAGEVPNRRRGRKLYCRTASIVFAARCRHGRMVRIALNIVGSLLVLAGATWFLQGINVLPGSFMTGQIRWAVYGGVAVAAGVGLLLRAKRSPKDRGKG